MEARAAETPQEKLERLRLEVAELRASRERLVRAADAERRRIERALHNGVHQHLIGLALDVQLTRASMESDPAKAKTLLDEMGRDVQRALEETIRLAQWIYLPQLAGVDLGAALRAAAASAGIPASIEVSIAVSHPQEVVSSVHLCCLEALEGAGAGATVTVRDEDGIVSFVVGSSGEWPDAELERLRDRVEALGGQMTIEPAGDGLRASARLPLVR